MTPRLPPLRAIEAFVVVAGTLSYTKAASELNLTKSAISRRIRSLESDLCVRLFHRTNKALELTADGEAYYKLTGPAFDALRTAGTLLERPRRNNILRIALPPSFASYWLIPRLPSVYEKHPEIDLHLDSLGYFKKLDGDNIDLVLQAAKEHLRDVVQEVIVTAQRSEETLQTVPIAVTALSGADLKAQRPEGGADYQIRGIGFQVVSTVADTGVGVDKNNVALVVNRPADADFFDVERVEVLRGPQGTPYGRNATGGVINTITNKPTDTYQGAITAEYGSYNSAKVSGFVNIPFNGMLQLRVAAVGLP